VTGQAVWLRLQRGDPEAFTDAARSFAHESMPRGAGFEGLIRMTSALGTAATGRLRIFL
jgi:hypothetical protein